MISPAVNSAATTIHSNAVALRFPNFPCGWPSLDYRVFSDYESFCYGCAPSYECLRESVRCYVTFKDSPFPMSPGDAYFWKCLSNNRLNDVFFIDIHFDTFKMNRLVSFLEDIPPIQNDERVSIVVLTKEGKGFPGKGSKEWKEIQEMAQGWERKSLQLRILADCDAPLVHDRFVVADGLVWHFGASVGGMYGGLNAYSGPWEDVSDHLLSLAQRFFKGSREFFSCGN